MFISQVNVNVDPIPGLSLIRDSNYNTIICGCPDTSPHKHVIHVSVEDEAVIGEVNVTVTITNNEDLSICGARNAKSIASRDRITRPLKIVPEGKLHFYPFSLDMKDSPPCLIQISPYANP